MAVDPLDVDLAALTHAAFLDCGATGIANGAGGHPGHARGGGRSGRVDGAGRARRERDLARSELGLGDLEDHADEPLPHLDPGAVDGGAPVDVDLHPCGAVVVESLREADVLEADRESDAPLDAFAPRRVARAARKPDRIARQCLGLGHGNRGGGTNDLCDGQRSRQDLPRRQRVAALDRVQQAELDRVDPERLGEAVHLRLGGEAHLHGAEAAHRAARRIVGVDRRALDQGVVDAVRAEREGRCVRDHGGRARGVGTAVDQDPHVDADDASVAGRAMLGPDLGGVPVDVAGERLLAVVDDLHRPVGVERQHRGVDLDREVLATAERAADAGEVHPHLLVREPEAGGDLVAVDVEPLRRDVDVDAALAVGNRDARLRPEERLILAAELVDALDRDVAFDVRVAVPDHDRADDVRPRVVAVAVARRRPVGMERLLLGRALGIDDELERLVLDDDRLGGAARLLGMLGGDERHRLAEVADAVDREHRLVGELEPVGLAAGNVLVREDGVDARHRHGLRDVDRDDAGVGVRAAERVPPQHSRRIEIARVRELSLHLGRPVRPADGLADVAELEPGRRLGRGRRHACHAAAARTASKIFW